MSLSLPNACVPGTFSPSVFGANISSVQANLVSNYSSFAIDYFRYTAPSVQVENATFCNVTVTYTHPGQNDTVITEAWLPLNWNERFMAAGGGGWTAGRFFLSYSNMDGAIADGYATVTTDAGLGNSSTPETWALRSPGVVDLFKYQNMGSVALNDEAIIAKSLIKSFYGKDPKYSYWNGCSHGGRQGMMMAQRFPSVYDGIAAGAPAIHWNELASYAGWAYQIMSEIKEYPYPCEVDAITAAAVSACDSLDGVTDGIIAEAEECLVRFDPFSVVGKTTACAQLNGTEKAISKTAAIVVNATWHGMTTEDGQQVYHGLLPGADLTGNGKNSLGQGGLAATLCNESGCGVGAGKGSIFFRLFVEKNAEADVSNITRAQFDDFVHSARQQYDSFMETADPDLRRFQEAGGKLLTFHGLADSSIPSRATKEYYNAVTGVIPNIHDFYRYYEVPGLGHCFGGVSGQPDSLFQQLRNWVENGTAPESTPVKVTVGENEVHNRILCPYPQKAQFSTKCGNASVADCWACAKPSGSNSLKNTASSSIKATQLRLV
ncbi:uncharacterized protein CTRU02_215231 [Colletotrichum truncatum]|uniref:Uncharacterized protein n=1 Tax=Colletotrichum truncatum TaxID=5467 RepID=A0ACC3YD69_COLTU|nr:uncharacterized protein CTRU02_12272 [Colletotrichum truncatum]KAF6784811.1 hypothetical protein CTRU02_12272 [Colletotrichum truncatum]